MNVPEIPGVNIILVDSLDSTNNYASKLLAKGPVEEGTVILTFRQTQGRGYGKNVWESEFHQNLTFSLILKPHFLPPSRQFLLSQIVSLGIVTFLETRIQPVAIKWPNDILHEGQKIAGILIENNVLGDNLAASVAGIGININQKNFPACLPHATSLSKITGKTHPLDQCLGEIISEIMNWYEILKKGNQSFIQQEYLHRLFKMGEFSVFRKENKLFEARIEGVDEFGQLLLREISGEISAFPFKSVEMIIHP